MKITIITIVFLFANCILGQNKDVQFNEIIPEYITMVWENKGNSNNAEYDAPELIQIKAFFTELRKRTNNITSNEFIKKPSDNTLVAHYLSTKLQWNAFNGPHVGLKKLSTKKVIKNSIKKLPPRNELLAFYYSSIFIDVLNKQKTMDLAETNIDLENLGLNSDTEKAILFLTAMRHVGNQVTLYSEHRFPDNCSRAKLYVENMPKFNSKPFYLFELPQFDDFNMEIDKRYPKSSFKKRYIPEFKNAKSSYENCLAEEKN